MWLDLSAEIAAEFAELENGVDVGDLIRGFSQFDPESRKARDKAYDAKRKGRVRASTSTRVVKPKTDRKAYLREYMRTYMRKVRAAKKAA